MNKNFLNIGIPSKGRLRKDVLNIFKKSQGDLSQHRLHTTKYEDLCM